MTDIINWKDEYYISDKRIVLTSNETRIPGVRLIASHKIQDAILPLLPHYHEGAYEFTLVTEGNMSFYMNQQEYNVSGGCVFVSLPDEIHSTNNIPITLNHQYWLQLDITDSRNLLFLNDEAALDLLEELSQIDHHVIATDNGEIRHVMKKAFELCQSDGNRRQAAAYIHIFLELLITASRKAPSHNSTDIETALSYLDRHIEDDLSLDELAGLCHLSTSQFKQKFRQVVGTAPRHYINEKKIARSKELLKEGFSVTDVAMRLNFNSSSYFSTVFKKYTLLTPIQYIYTKRAERVYAAKAP